MELVIKAVSKNRRGLLSNNTWYNADKSLEGECFKDVKPGDVLEAEISDGKWVKSFDKTDGKAPTETGGQVSKATPSRIDPAFRTPEQIIRQEAVGHVFASPVLAVAYKDLANEETVSNLKELTESVVSYVTMGEWKNA